MLFSAVAGPTIAASRAGFAIGLGNCVSTIKQIGLVSCNAAIVLPCPFFVGAKLCPGEPGRCPSHMYRQCVGAAPPWTGPACGSKLLPSNCSSADPTRIPPRRRSRPFQRGATQRHSCNQRSCYASRIRLRLRRAEMCPIRTPEICGPDLTREQSVRTRDFLRAGKFVMISETI